jgi:hypothetical protein
MSFKKDRKKPCSTCPFRKDNITKSSLDLGGATPFTYIGQSIGPFWLPCHMDKNYEWKDSDTSKVNQCAGAAIYRTNVGVADNMHDQILTLPEDKELVFATHAEFLAHYMEVSVEDAENFFKQNPDALNNFLMKELEDMKVRIEKLQ